MSSNSDNHSEIPEKVTNKYVAGVKTGRSFRSGSSNRGTKRPKLSTYLGSHSMTNLLDHEPSPIRSKSETTFSRQLRKPDSLFNGMHSQKLLESRLVEYGLDFVDDPIEHMKNIQDPNSKWFCKDVLPNYKIEDNFPFKSETHQEQAQYLCHILVNLYISLSSDDLQGLLNISSKDLAQFKTNIDQFSDVTNFSKATESDMEENMSIYDENQTDYDTMPDEEFDGADGAEDDEEDEENGEDSEPEFSHSGKITVKSSSIINVNHWTNELRNCIHFDIPIKLRLSLAKIYYSLTLAKGQKVFRQLHVEVFELLVATDYENVNFTKLLKKHGLTLDYKLLLDILGRYFPDPEAEYQQYDIQNSSHLKLFKLLLKHAHNAKPFFSEKDEEILPTLMEYIIGSFSPSTVSIVSPMITSLIPYHYNKKSNITDLFPFVFSLWRTAPISAVLDTHLYELIGDISQEAYTKLITEENPPIVSKSGISFGELGLLNLDQVQFIFNRVQNHLRNDFQIVSFSRTAKPFVYFINGSSPEYVFEQLALLIQSIETFIHPSNSGKWTKMCAKFIHAFIKAYHARYILESEKSSKYRPELKLNAYTHSKIIDIFTGPIMLGSLNKNSDIAHYYISSLAYLLNLKAENSYIIYDRVLIDVYESLTDQYVNSIHRVFSSLKQFGRIVRFMVMDDLYRIHITNVLSMVVSKLDPNDPVLSNILVNTIASICSYIPIENFVGSEEYITFESTTLPLIEQHLYYIKDNGSSKGFSVDNSDLDKALRASTALFDPIVRVYTDKIFSFIDADLEEILIFKLNQTTMICIESMSDDLFDKFAHNFETFFWNGEYLRVKKPNYDLLGITCGAIIKRDAKKYVPKFFKSVVFQINQEIERGAGSIRSSKIIEQRDVKLVAMLNVLTEMFRQSHEQLLPIKQEIMELLIKIYTTITNPPIDIVTSLLLHNILTSLVTTEIIEYRLFKNDVKLTISEKWGGYQFNKNKYKKENMDFKWHVPTSDEIDFAMEIMDTFFQISKDKITSIIENPTHDTKQTDSLKKFILILTHTLSGSSLLFDSEYNKELKKHESSKANLFAFKGVGGTKFSCQPLEDIESNGKDDDDISVVVGAGSFAEKHDDIEIMENEDVLVEDFDSSAPSGAGTPVPGEHFDDASLSSSEFTFKELSIYKTNYFFGVTNEEKFSDKRYTKVHNIRSNIGLLFHNLAEFLKNHYENNTNISQIFLHGLKVFFTDVGQETIFNEDPTSSLDYDFIEGLQSLAHIVDPFTRTCIAAKVQYFHQSRVYLRSTNRVPSKMETTLLTDIIDLSTSVYPDVAKPAQGCLLDTIRQLVGSYRYVIGKLMTSFEKALEENNELKLESILSAINTKKLLSKIYNDFKNIQGIIDLLFRASLLKHQVISQTAESLLRLVTSNLRIPSSVCEMEPVQDLLYPGDKFIKDRIEVVKEAKEAKRLEYMDVLVNLRNYVLSLFETQKDSINWGHSLIFIETLSKLQTNMEFDIDTKVIEKLFEQTKESHPSIVLSATNGIIGIVNRVFYKAELHQKISNKYSSSFQRSSIKTLNTTGLEGDLTFNARNFNEKFESEKPNWFIDNKTFVGYFCWGRPLNVVVPGQLGQNLELTPADISALKLVGSLITIDYLKNYVKFLISENEMRKSFSHQNVEFFSMILHLFFIGHGKAYYSDVTSLCMDIFDKYDKAKIIMSAEIFCAIVISSKYMFDDEQREEPKMQTEFMNKYMSDLFSKHLNNDTLEVFQVVFWWLPNHIDLRRCPQIISKLTSLKDINSSAEKIIGMKKDFFMKDKDSNNESISLTKLDSLSPSSIDAKVTLFRYLAMSMNNRIPSVNLSNELIFNYPYENVRRGISNCINLLIIGECVTPFDDFVKMNNHILTNKKDGLGNELKAVPSWFDVLFKSEMNKIETIYNDNYDFFQNCKPQDIIEHEFYFRCNTMYHLLFTIVANSVIPIGKYVCDYLVPFLDRLFLMKDVCKLGNMYPDLLYMRIARSIMDLKDIDNIVKTLVVVGEEDNGTNGVIIHNKLSKHFNTSHGIRLQMSFFQEFYSNKIFILTKEQKLAILNYFVSNLYNSKSLEVRVKSSEVLSGIIHTISLTRNNNNNDNNDNNYNNDEEIKSNDYSNEIIDELIVKFESRLCVDLKLKDKKEMIKKTSEDGEKNVIEIHGSIIGLGALIAAFPYVSPLPKWIPKQLSNLSSWAKVSGICGSSSKDIISNFKKIRSDTWHIDRESFTSEELENLEGVNWRSYYA